MRKSILLLSTCFFICISCSKKDTTAISSIVDNVETLVSRHDNNVQSYIDGKRFSFINTTSKATLDSIKTQLNQLIIMDLPSKQEKLRESAIDYIESLENIVKSQNKYASLTDSTTLSQAEEIDKANAQVINIADKGYKKYIEQLNASK